MLYILGLLPIFMCAWRICCSMMSMLFSNYPTNHASTPSLSWVLWMFLVDISLFPAKIILYPIKSILLMLKIPISSFSQPFWASFFFRLWRLQVLRYPIPTKDVMRNKARAATAWFGDFTQKVMTFPEYEMFTKSLGCLGCQEGGAIWKWPIEIVDYCWFTYKRILKIDKILIVHDFF